MRYQWGDVTSRNRPDRPRNSRSPRFPRGRTGETGHSPPQRFGYSRCQCDRGGDGGDADGAGDDERLRRTLRQCEPLLPNCQSPAQTGLSLHRRRTNDPSDPNQSIYQRGGEFGPRRSRPICGTFGFRAQGGDSRECGATQPPDLRAPTTGNRGQRTPDRHFRAGGVEQPAGESSQFWDRFREAKSCLSRYPGSVEGVGKSGLSV